MKIKRLKKLIQLASKIGKYDVTEMHVQVHKYPLPDGTPNILLPIKGPYVKPETKEIIKIVRSMDPNTIVDEAYKANAQAGIKLFSIFGDQRFPNLRAVFFHTPYGSIVIDIEVPGETKKVGNVQVEIDEPDAKEEIDISNEYQLL